MQYTVELTDSNWTINNIPIQNNKADYTLVDRECYIEELMRWIVESKNESDKKLMLADLKRLILLGDIFILSSTESNEFLTRSDNKEEFDKCCEELLKIERTEQCH